MAVIIELTLEQVSALKEERAKLGVMEDLNSPGMMIAQVFGDHMRVGVIDNTKAQALRIALGGTPDGKTVRTAYEDPA